MTPSDSRRMQSVRSEASVVHATGSVNSRVLEILRSGSELSRWSPMSPSRVNATLDSVEEEERRTEMDTLMWYYGLHSDQLNEELHPEDVSVERAAKERTGILLLFLRVSSSSWFRWWCFGVIAANTVFMGFQANALAMGELESLPAYRNLEIAFVLWFIVESIIRFWGGTTGFCHDHWLQLDTVVIGISAVDIFILTPSGALKDSTWSGSFFVVFRVLRLARVVKLVRAVGIFQSLQNMLHAVWYSKINFLCVVVLLATLSFIISLVLMSLVGPVSGLTSDEVPEDILLRFSSVQRSMVTLFESLLQGEEWGKQVLRPLLNSRTPLAGVIFGAFGSFGQFCIMNLISGLFIEQMFKTVKLNNETQEHEHIYLDQNGAECLKRVFQEIGNGRRALTWKQFSEGLVRHPDVVMQLGVNLELANALFDQLALDSSDVVDIDEFVFGMIKLTRQSKTIDMLVIDYQQQRAQKDVSRLSNRFRRDVERLQATLEHLAKHLSEILTDCQPLRGTLKGRLKRHIRRVSRQTSSARSITWGSTAENSEGGSSSSKMPSKSLLAHHVAPLKPWLQLLETEGRPRMRQELAALLASTAAPDASASTAPAAIAAPPAVRKLQSQREELAPHVHDLPLSCLTQVPQPNLGFEASIHL